MKFREIQHNVPKASLECPLRGVLRTSSKGLPWVSALWFKDVPETSDWDVPKTSEQDVPGISDRDVPRIVK